MTPRASRAALALRSKSAEPAAGWPDALRFDGAALDAALASAAPTAAIGSGRGAVPEGPIFQVSSITAGDQYGAGLIALEDGGFLARWRTFNGTSYTYYTQRHDAAGDPVGLLNSTIRTHLVALEGGGFLSVWDDVDADDEGVFARLYDQNLAELGPAFQVNTTTANEQDASAAAALDGGGFVIVWESPDGASNGIFAQRYDSAGAALGAQFRLNSLTPGNQLIPTVQGLPGGGFVAAWVTVSSGNDVYARLFDAAGNPVGPDKAVNSYTVGFQQYPDIAVLEGGGFVIIWDGTGGDGGGGGIFGQIYDGAGNAMGGNLRLSAPDGVFRQTASIAALPGGGFLVTWDANAGDPADVGIFARGFDAAGNPVGPEFRVNEPDTHGAGADLVILADGRILVAWSHDDQDGVGLYGRFLDPAHHATEQVALDLKGFIALDDDGPGAVTVTLSVDHGRLDIAPGGSDAAVSGSGSATVTIGGTLAQVQALLGSDPASIVRFTATGDAPPATVSFSVTIEDGDGNVAGDTETLYLTAVNDAPVNAFGGPAEGRSDEPIALEGLSVFDADTTGPITVHFGVAHGTLTLRTDVAGGIAAANITGGGQGTGGITLNATQAQINATLAAANGLVYSADPGFIGSDALTIATHEGVAGDPVRFNWAASIGTGATPSSVTAGDLNADGKLDLVVANEGSNFLSVFLGTGNGSFAPRTDYTVGAGTRNVVLASMNSNQDSFVDIVVADGGGTIGILRGNGNGTFQARTTTPASLAQDLVVADFNLDGKADVAVTRWSNGLQVMFGTGNGTFSGGATYQTGTEMGQNYASRGIDKGDFNGDGLVDLIVANDTNVGSTSNGSVSLLPGSATGAFGAPIVIAAPTRPREIVVSDFNGDGDFDFAIRDQLTSTISVYLGHGDGSFAAPVAYAVAAGSGSIAVADLNGDGRPDIVAGSDGTPPTQLGAVAVFVGNGDGTFQAADTTIAGNNLRAVATGDFDGDGQTDIAVADQFRANVTLLLNRGEALSDVDLLAINVTDTADIVGTPDNDYLEGTGGNDRIFGQGGDDVINAGAGNDLLDGGPGDDTFEGGQGDDEIVGGTGQDTLRLLASPSGGVVDLDAGTVTGEGSDTVSGVEFIEGSRFADELTGDGEDNRIYGAGGADIIAGGGGNDELDGDRYDPAGFNATAIDEIGGGAGDDHLVLGLNDIGDGGADFDLLEIRLFNHPTGTVIDLSAMWSGGTGTNGTGTVTGFERIYMIAGSSGDDTITVGTGQVIGSFGPGHVLGYGGNDQLTGGGDRDSLHGGDGNDVVLGLGNDDQLSGWDGSDRIEGGAGDDTIDGGRDADVLIGGAGSDLYSYHDGYFANIDEIVEAAEDSGIDTLFVSPDWNGSVADWAFTGVRNVEVAQLRTLQDVAGFEFTLAAQFQAAGFTTLVASADIDASQVTADMNIVVDRPNIRPLTVLSGSGDDHFSFAQYTLPPFVEDYLLDAGAGIDTVYFANSDEAVMAGFEASLILRGFEAFALGPGTDPVAVPDGDDIDGRHQRYRISLSDSIVAEGVSFLVDASALRANFVGSLGSDDEIGGTGANADSVGSDQLVLDASALSADRSINVLGGAGGDILKGGAGGDTLDGGGGDDELHGGTGNDKLAGGLGNDRYIVDSAGDVVTEAPGEGTDIIYASVSYTLAANTDVESLSTITWEATTALNLTGNGLANQLIGNAGRNQLNGAAGADIMFGREGNDTYLVDNAGDKPTEIAGQGTDTVYTSVSYTLAANADVEGLATIDFQATTALNLTGNGIVNQLIGNDGANQLDGKAGADTMTGRAGNDKYLVDNALDRAFEAAGGGTDVVYTGVSFVLTDAQEIEGLSTITWELTNAINLTGNSLKNNLIGNAGVNVLDGRAGNDTLQGREGADSYAFTSVLGPQNIDVILGFSSADDTIVLENNGVFVGLAAGALPASAFAIGTAAQDFNDRIIYDQATGRLFFDADGNGAGAQIQFARLDGAPIIAANDFTVI